MRTLLLLAAAVAGGGLYTLGNSFSTRSHCLRFHDPVTNEMWIIHGTCVPESGTTVVFADASAMDSKVGDVLETKKKIAYEVLPPVRVNTEAWRRSNNRWEAGFLHDFQLVVGDYFQFIDEKCQSKTRLNKRADKDCKATCLATGSVVGVTFVTFVVEDRYIKLAVVPCQPNMLPVAAGIIIIPSVQLAVGGQAT